MARYRINFNGERRTAKVTVQLTPSERSQLDDAAQAAGTGLSEYIRRRCLQRQKDRQPVVAGTTRNPAAKALADELRAIGNNVNQIARVANQTGDIRRGNTLDVVLERLKEALARIISL